MGEVTRLGPATDTDITGNTRVGMHGHPGTNAWTIRDDFQASDLAAAFGGSFVRLANGNLARVRMANGDAASVRLADGSRLE